MFDERAAPNGPRPLSTHLIWTGWPIRVHGRSPCTAAQCAVFGGAKTEPLRTLIAAADARSEHGRVMWRGLRRFRGSAKLATVAPRQNYTEQRALLWGHGRLTDCAMMKECR